VTSLPLPKSSQHSCLGLSWPSLQPLLLLIFLVFLFLLLQDNLVCLLFLSSHKFLFFFNPLTPSEVLRVSTNLLGVLEAWGSRINCQDRMGHLIVQSQARWTINLPSKFWHDLPSILAWPGRNTPSFCNFWEDTV
jgi:hypothetical protein